MEGKQIRRIGYIQKMSVMHKLQALNVQIQAMIKLMADEHRTVNVEQLEGILITLNKTLEVLWNEP